MTGVLDGPRVADDVHFEPRRLDRTSPIYVAGHGGLVGSAIVRHLDREGFSNIVCRSHRQLDLTHRDSVFAFFKRIEPRYVILAAAKVGGIVANNLYPTEFLSTNLQIQTNVLDAALTCDVERLLFLGSSCIYPRNAPQPIEEYELLNGYLEPTNDAYAIAKIAGIIQVQSVRRQYGKAWICAMPTNLYGPGDNFSLRGSHVLPALIRRYDDAVRLGRSVVTNWGTGNPRREFLHSDDLADACLYLLEHYDGPQHVNIGTGTDVSIRELAGLIATLTGFAGDTRWDESQPDGVPQKLLSIRKLSQAGWTASIDLEQGLRSTIDWYRYHRAAARGADDRQWDLSRGR